MVTIVVVETGRCFMRGSFRSVLSAETHYSQGLQMRVHASLKVSSESDAAKARRLLEKAEHVCLISNSLRGQRTLVTEVVNTG
jgi:organic hydroperoxide reductase OsmC/OhrA